MSQRLLKSVILVGVVLASGYAQAQDAAPQDGQLYDGVVHLEGSSPEDLQNYQSSLMDSTGYHVDTADLSAPFLVEPEVRQVFGAASHLRANLPAGRLPTTFQPIVDNVTDYINKMAGKDNERHNGISNSVLAARIVRVSFCFDTDPYGVAAQIKTESSFDRKRVSPTGAVGFTQMTSVAIDEVNDQLGNRGLKAANSNNIPYLRQAISCYMGGKKFSPMFAAGVIPQGKSVKGNRNLSSRAKAWLKADLDRQLIYGQIVLKVYLANARNDGKTGSSAFRQGMQNYNGDKKHGQDKKYAKSILAQMSKI